MTISIDPRAFGSPFLTWVSLFALLGLAAGTAVLMWRAPAFDGTRAAVYAVAMRTVLWSVLGARVLHVFDFWGFYSASPYQSLYLWNGGFSLWGAVIAGSAGALWHARRRGFDSGRFADRLAIAGLAAMVLGRVGDFMAGERPATLTDLPWAVTYAHPNAEAYLSGASIHPVALYEILVDLAVLGALVWFVTGGRRLRPEGASLALAVALYAFGRFIIALAVVGPAFLGLHQAQWIALGVLVAVAVYGWRVRPNLRLVSGPS